MKRCIEGKKKKKKKKARRKPGNQVHHIKEKKNPIKHSNELKYKTLNFSLININ
jgi:propanediol dehydratase large subunit